MREACYWQPVLSFLQAVALVAQAVVAPGKVNVRAGTDLTLPCNATLTFGTEETRTHVNDLNVAWYRDTTRLAEHIPARDDGSATSVSDDLYRAETVVFADFDRLSLTNKLELKIKSVTVADSGLFRCFVNSQSDDAYNTDVTVQDVPSTPGTPVISGYTDSSVNITWTPPLLDNNSDLHHYLVEYKSEVNDIWNETDSIQVNADDPSAHIPNLLSNTVYTMRVIAVNAVGRSIPSQPSLPVMTLRAEGEGDERTKSLEFGKPGELRASNLSSTSLKITWLPPTLLSHHPRIEK